MAGGVVTLIAAVVAISVVCGHAEELNLHAKYEKIVAEIHNNSTLRALVDANDKEILKLTATEKVFTEFPCIQLKPSKTVPTSVHQLRPGDIKVVAGLGDSITAGRAAGNDGIEGVLHDYRGKSFSIGGDESFETLPTLPNILKQYNPELRGYSTGIGDGGRYYNLAISGARSDQLFGQAKRLLEAMKADPNIDFKNDWKVITILMGANDLCQWCLADIDASPETYMEHVESTLDYLSLYFPRTYVNLIDIMKITIARHFFKSPLCYIIHQAVCECVFNPTSEEAFSQLEQVTLEYQRRLEELVASGKYDKNDDFTVVLQPFEKYTLLPTTKSGDYDFSFFAADCFHPNRKGHKATAISLWNSMLQPEGNKSTAVDWYNGKMICPTQETPYLATRLNGHLFNPKPKSGAKTEQAKLLDWPPVLPIAVGSSVFAIVVLVVAGFLFKKRKVIPVQIYEQF